MVAGVARSYIGTGLQRASPIFSAAGVRALARRHNAVAMSGVRGGGGNGGSESAVLTVAGQGPPYACRPVCCCNAWTMAAYRLVSRRAQPAAGSSPHPSAV